ncbi:TPA: hypothetical protein N0F65_008070 [Lagenidium giganteum]|uniref:protein-tyrosine-phosphatase n=1 Tax=Lagenidium giganteum TaxID=4803 RepID=A0AAV2YT21_9STRA|nr:TPA: hypothetical protein N0F65_008070 [Lagenidium giganteum]
MCHRALIMSNDAAPAQVLEHVFLGAKAHAKDKELLQRLNITHILNVTPTRAADPATGVPNFFEKEKAFIYRRCAVYDNKAEDISGMLRGCIAFIEQAKFHGRVLVHCNKGISRSSSIVIAYVMKTLQLSFDDALAMVAAKRPMINPNASFRTQLQQYDRRLRQQRTKAARSEDSSTRSGTAPIGPAARPAIGPQLPPHLRRSEPQEVEPATSKAVESKADADGASKNVVIGPALPPSLKRRISEEAESSAASEVRAQKKERRNPVSP